MAVLASHHTPYQYRSGIFSFPTILSDKSGRGHERECRHRRKHGARTTTSRIPSVQSHKLAARRVDGAYHCASRHNACNSALSCPHAHAQTVIYTVPPLGMRGHRALFTSTTAPSMKLGIHACDLRHSFGSNCCITQPTNPMNTGLRTSVSSSCFDSR